MGKGQFSRNYCNLTQEERYNCIERFNGHHTKFSCLFINILFFVVILVLFPYKYLKVFKNMLFKYIFLNKRQNIFKCLFLMLDLLITEFIIKFIITKKTTQVNILGSHNNFCQLVFILNLVDLD